MTECLTRTWNCCRKGDDMVVKHLTRRIIPFKVKKGLPSGSDLYFHDAKLLSTDEDDDAVTINLRHFMIEALALEGKAAIDVPGRLGQLMGRMAHQDASIVVTVSVFKEHTSPTCDVTVLDISTDHNVANMVLDWGVRDVIKQKVEEKVNAAINERLRRSAESSNEPEHDYESDSQDKGFRLCCPGNNKDQDSDPIFQDSADDQITFGVVSDSGRKKVGQDQ
eukprot:gnl/MRDRNA2_/MRDRNA2_20278_c0_seq1.p1 gnl/MRDRNA2_/MRDRNA2_20278_c0~~gnl/MRDRNA2_/MRDRNA2_20278_c0_seq1.p1  ORF type:complete len:222 (+),score=39.95 gnl/MRDRNA2_/MRDRNA2_20278_c0_seq1:153-818(+)